MKRTGPHPLSAHLTHAAQEYARRAPVLGDAVQGSVEEMVAGVQKYQSYGDLPSTEPLECCWQLGSVRLLHVAGQNAAQDDGRRPLLLVPSLINRYHVFDLHPERSFVRWLEARGRAVYVLDWGDVCQSKGQNTMEALIEERLLAAVRFLAQRYDVAAVDALGYCMGGVLLCAAASIAPALFHDLVFLAAPWDFEHSDDAMVREMRLWSSTALAHISSQKFLASSHTQGLFAGLHPEVTLAKFSKFLHMNAGSLEEELFVATEDWLNHGVDLPADVAFVCIREWYGQNLTGQGRWCVGDHAIKAEMLQHRALVVASKRDRLVSFGSACALADHMINAEIINPDCGHIGMMCGRSTVESVWVPINAWLDS